MSQMNDGSKYIFKLTAIITVIIINIIAIIAVVTTVGSALKNLKKDISSGKIVSSQNQTQNNETEYMGEQESFEEQNELDFSNLLKIVMADKSVMRAVILMVIALVLLGVAVFILIKLK